MSRTALGVGDEGDDSHLAAAAWADERKDLIDPREQQRPGVAGGATQERFLCPLCFLLSDDALGR
jgi:hypothetical protein